MYYSLVVSNAKGSGDDKDSVMPAQTPEQYKDLKDKIEKLQEEMEEVKKVERAAALKQCKELCEEFGFTARMLGSSLARGRKRQRKTETQSSSVDPHDAS